jgi:GrpB-like predicted nucleotidyltransferase (UPF0157 family)
MRRDVVLFEYNPDWPRFFDDFGDRIRAALREYSATLEHIGSTAVPGLAAKPVIDMMLGVPSLDGVLDDLRLPLETAGFQWMEAFLQRMPERLFFFHDDSQGRRTGHLHVLERDGREWRRHLAFRDYLRAHPEVADEYERLKRELAPQFDDTIEYSDAKTLWIRRVEQRALEEVFGGS